MRSMRKYLNKLKKIKPIFPSIKSQLIPIFDIKIIIFDVYGTLIISSSGDVDTTGFSGKGIMKCFNKLKIKIIIENKEFLVKTIKDEYHKRINIFHKKLKDKGYPYPEVDIIVIWKQIINTLNKLKYIKIDEKIDYKELAFLFELTNNQVYPMPLMKKIIKYFYKNGFKLGIISNAQFYTPITMNFFLNKNLKETENIDLFDPKLTFFSYKYLKAKPDTYLFQQAKEICEKMNIKSEEVVYIGNDMLNDIWGAKQVGFKTILFAGDQRSLRLREDDNRVSLIKPDATITKLKQLKNIIEG